MHRADTPIRVLIADDETSARRRLLQFLADETDMVVVAECRDGRATCLAIEQLAPDLVFLDVEMPEYTGLQVLEKIGVGRMPATIFATAFDHYAVAAFDANAIDYLLKPFARPRFARAVAKARARLRSGDLAESHAELAGVLSRLACASNVSERILVRVGESQQLIKTADIMYVTAEKNYVRLHAKEEHYQVRETMVGMLERLEPALFRRIHRSHIVNLDHVRKILPWFGGDSLVMMSDGSRLTLSRNYRSALDDLV
ncbi:LytR/AlgR family response regulator transcription factor [Massilia glaciei]|uniref:DNA-binding response regulator n=1 Tax=Massilia glaciei TaxID=1524097 RepID=A0A2U2HGX7_9BURK|nr:LytTR family DNA-binding domain-containing protein [Massilia glaciei]PWF44690.1 DNA-binding response regulator [Massilia glaciei]